MGFVPPQKAKGTVTLDLKVFNVLNKTLDDATHDNAWNLTSGSQGMQWLAADTDDDKAGASLISPPSPFTVLDSFLCCVC